MSNKFKKISILLTMIICVSIINLGNVYANTTKYDNYEDSTVKCGYSEKSGDYLIDGIPSKLPQVLKIVYISLQIAVPVILVILGSIDLFKSITAGKDDEIKKGQQTFIKRLIAAAIVFFIFAIVKFVVTFVGNDNSSRVMNCAKCLLNNNCKKSS